MKSKLRESNMELLRILSMVLIIVAHITLHAFDQQLSNNIVYGAGVYFNRFAFYKRLGLIQIFGVSGQIGNIIFVLIAGYFLVNKKKINLTKSITKLISQMIFATLLLVILSCAYQIIIDKSFRGLVTTEIFNNLWWFVGYYIIIIICGDLFLNKYLSKMDKKSYLLFLLIMLSLASLNFPGATLDGLSSNLRKLVFGLFVYSLGGYVRKYKLFKNIKSIIFVLMIFLMLGLIYLDYYNYITTNINTALFNNSNNFIQSFIDKNQYSIEILVIGICLFELFSRLTIKNNKIINYIASATFMIYLTHETPFTFEIWRKKDWIGLYYNNIFEFFGLYIKWIVICLIFGFVAYVIYSYLMKLFSSVKIKKIVLKK